MKSWNKLRSEVYESGRSVYNLVSCNMLGLTVFFRTPSVFQNDHVLLQNRQSGGEESVSCLVHEVRQDVVILYLNVTTFVCIIDLYPVTICTPPLLLPVPSTSVCGLQLLVYPFPFPFPEVSVSSSYPQSPCHGVSWHIDTVGYQVGTVGL
jgi:hypothetical protein